MYKITEKIAALSPGENFHSLEFFPPKTDMGFQNLNARLERMATALRPLFVTVTWGAGGSTCNKSLQLAEICQRQLDLTTCLHLTCTNTSRTILDEALELAKRAGIRNILALRGDPPRNSEYFDTPCDGTKGLKEGEEFKYAVDLVRYIRQRYGDFFCIGVAAYPEGHAEGTVPEIQDPKFDLPFLIEKVRAGADFIMTQLFYDADKYIDCEKMLREDPSEVFKDIVVIPGLMPIQSYQTLRRTSKLSHASIPPSILAELDGVKGDDARVKEVGVKVLSEIITKIKSVPSTGPRGFHFYTLNLEKAVSFVLERSGLIPEDDSAVVTDSSSGDMSVDEQNRQRRVSSIAHAQDHLIVDNIQGRRDSNLLTTAQEAGFLAPTKQSAIPSDVTLAISEGEGTLGREATWDDFPNGRFGDARSPAFGEIDGYGPSLHVSRAQAVQLWGYPVTPGDISDIFVRHISGGLSAIPWSEEDLRDESSIIRDKLISLNRKGWWTIASQPAVNGARSDHITYGWGPRGGFVFQKAFVEFFVSPPDWENLEAKLVGMGEEVSYYAASGKGQYKSNMASSAEALNAVTWGCFKGKEIITPTIIEEVNFKAWKDEAFSIWKEWGAVYPPQSTTRKLLCDIARNYWLVNVVHHEYMNRGILWKILEEI